MSVADSTYYGLTRVRDQTPEARDWAVTDSNIDVISRLLKAFEQHAHTGVQPLKYPGYNESDISAPTLATLTEASTGGVLSPGSDIGVRLSYVHDNGLETEASPEKTLTLSAAAARALTPQLTSGPTAEPDGIPGGSYIYGITKVKGSGETPISDLLPVEIPYDQTYKLTLTYDAISTYTDGTEKLNIYRSEGMDSAFYLVAQVSDTSATTFEDLNEYVDTTVSPPTANTFDAIRSVTIDWSAITHPDDAKTLRVYVTQQNHLWGSNHILQQIDLVTGPVPTSYVYTGTEVLSNGWPKDSTQLASAPPKINLNAEVTGSLIYDANYDAKGFYTRNFNVGPSPNITKTDGMIWYDPETGFMGYADGGDISLGNPDETYVHPPESSGGHIAANIKHHASSSNTAKDVLDYISDPSTGARKQVSQIQQADGFSGQYTHISGVNNYENVPDLALTVTPDFQYQYIRMVFSAHVFLTNSEAVGSFTFLVKETTSGATVNDITGDGWVRSQQGIKTPTFGSQFTINLERVFQLDTLTSSYEIIPRFTVNLGSILLVNNRRSLYVEKVF